MTQGSHAVFSVAQFGFSDAERRALARVFSLSMTRNPSFSVAAPDRQQPADILMVDGDDERAVADWRAFAQSDGLKTAAPTLMVARKESVPEGCFSARKPMIATRLLVALELVATEALGFSAVLAIDPRDNLTSGVRQASAAPARSAAGEQSSFNALVVDDSLPVRVQMDLALKPFASHVDFAETGEKAFELIRDKAYDIVFLDVILPGADGYEICKVIKSDPGRKDTPVIMLTSNSSPADRIKGRLAGCDTYLIKPVRHEVFLGVVERYFNLPAGSLPQLASGT